MATLTPRVMAHQPRDGGQTGQAGPGLHGLAGGPGPLRLVLDQAQVVMSDIGAVMMITVLVPGLTA